MILTAKKSENYVFISLLALSVLTPSIDLPDGFPAVRLEFIFVFGAWALIILKKLRLGLLTRFFTFPIYKWFWLLSITVFISMAYGAVVKSQPLVGKDFFELLKILQYVLTFSLIARLRINETSFEHAYVLAIIVLMLSAIFAFLQYINFVGINEWITPYYVSTQLEAVLNQTRITGTMGNPNEFGALMVLPAALSISGGLLFKKSKLRLFCWVSFPIFSFALFLTASRSALITLIVTIIAILLIFIVSRSLRHGNWRIIGFVIYCCVIGIIVLQFGSEKMFFRFVEMERIDQITSLHDRLDNWETHFELWKQSYLLGWGPAKASMGTIVDNEWLLLLRRYGVVGVIVFLGFSGSLFIGLSRIRKINTEESVVALSIALQATLCGYAIYMIPAAVYHCLQLMPILLLFLGLAYSQWWPPRTPHTEGSI